ncbi:MAG: hypothetical protein AAFY42_14570 [Pseudomonadota bacterium]
MSHKFAALGLVALVSACAPAPESIAPISMGNAFQSLSCGDAYAILQDEKTTLAALEERQRDAQAGDAIGVFLIGVPVSSLSGNDVSGEIAASKGKVIALENRMLTCRG